MTLKTDVRVLGVKARSKLGLSPSWRKGPAVLQIELHNYCNQNCMYCNTRGFHEGKHGVLPKKTLVKALEQAAPYIFEVRLFLNNEPTLQVPGAVSLNDALNLAKDICGVRTVIYTNGSSADSQIYLNQNLDDIHFTISAATPETYLRVHGVDMFSRAKSAFNFCMKHRRHGRVYVHFVEVAENMQELPQWRELFREADGLVVSPLHDGLGQYASKMCLRTVDHAKAKAYSTLKGKRAADLPCTLWNNQAVSCFGDWLQCCDAPYRFNYGKVDEVSLHTAWANRLANRRVNAACAACNLKTKKD